MWRLKRWGMGRKIEDWLDDDGEEEEGEVSKERGRDSEDEWVWGGSWNGSQSSEGAGDEW